MRIFGRGLSSNPSVLVGNRFVVPTPKEFPIIALLLQKSQVDIIPTVLLRTSDVMTTFTKTQEYLMDQFSFVTCEAAVQYGC